MSEQTTAKSKKVEKKPRTMQAIKLKDIGVTGERKAVSAEQGFSTWVRQLKQNGRQGTVGCKGRSDVARSTKKPWKQKGTGRARAGSARSPLWRGGGVTFGPQKRVRKLHLPQKIRARVLNNVFFDMLDAGNIVQLDWALKNDTPKTSAAHQALKGTGLLGKKITLFLSVDDALIGASFANIPQVKAVSFDQPNAFDLTNCSHWVVLKKDMNLFKGMVEQWI